MLIIKSTK